MHSHLARKEKYKFNTHPNADSSSGRDGWETENSSTLLRSSFTLNVALCSAWSSRKGSSYDISQRSLCKTPLNFGPSFKNCLNCTMSVPLRIVLSWFIVYVIFVSGCIINLVQAAVYAVFKLGGIKQKDQLIICQWIANLYMDMFRFMTEAWSGIKLYYSGDHPDNDYTVMIGN